jgi:hypothetical protein
MDVLCEGIKWQNAADNEAVYTAKKGRKPTETFTGHLKPTETFTGHFKASIGIKFSNP